MTDQPQKPGTQKRRTQGPAPGKPDWLRAGLTLLPIAAGIGITILLAMPIWGKAILGSWLLLCLIAWLGTLDAASRSHIARSLRDARFAQLYRFTANRQLKMLWRRFCDPVEEEAGLLPTLRAALTHRLLGGALGIAALYPLLVLILWWLIGFDVRLAGNVILPAAPLWPDRLMFLAMILVCVGLPPLLDGAAKVSQTATEAQFYYLLTPLVLYGAGTLFFSLSPFNVLLIAAIIQIFMVGRFIFSESLHSPALIASTSAVVGIGLPIVFLGEIGGAFLFLIALASAFSLGVMLLERRTPRFALAALCIALPGFWVIGGPLVSLEEVYTIGATVFALLAVLPLPNALGDAVSYAITLTLVRRGLAAGRALLHGVIDLMISLLLTVAKGILIIGTLTGLSAFSDARLLNIDAVLADVAANPHAYWWLYAMLFSTLVPTLLHGALSLLGAQALAPLAVRRPAADLLAGANETAWKAVAAPLAVGAVWALPVFAAGAILFGLWWIAGDLVLMLGGFYLETLTAFAAWIGAL